jgi:mannose-6-phosphate isomerase-like protein (cupin superfamily)
MAHVGKTIDHPLSGERLTFIETSATTGGSFLKMRLEMRTGGALPRPHIHPRAEERFEVAEGRVQIVTSGKTRVAEAGETVVVPRGADHVWGNPFDDPAAVVVTTTPALNLEDVLRDVVRPRQGRQSQLAHPISRFPAGGPGAARLPRRDRHARTRWGRNARAWTGRVAAGSGARVSLDVPALQWPGVPVAIWGAGRRSGLVGRDVRRVVEDQEDEIAWRRLQTDDVLILTSEVSVWWTGQLLAMVIKRCRCVSSSSPTNSMTRSMWSTQPLVVSQSAQSSA